MVLLYCQSETLVMQCRAVCHVHVLIQAVMQMLSVCQAVCLCSVTVIVQYYYKVLNDRCALCVFYGFQYV